MYTYHSIFSHTPHTLSQRNLEHGAVLCEPVLHTDDGVFVEQSESNHIVPPFKKTRLQSGSIKPVYYNEDCNKSFANKNVICDCYHCKPGYYFSDFEVTHVVYVFGNLVDEKEMNERDPDRVEIYT